MNRRQFIAAFGLLFTAPASFWKLVFAPRRKKRGLTLTYSMEFRDTDVYDELATSFAAEIQKEIDREIIRSLMREVHLRTPETTPLRLEAA